MPHPEPDHHHLDPYRNYRFRVKWDGHYVAGVSYVSALTWTTEVVEISEGGDPNEIRKLPGLLKFAPIILKRGYTADSAFEDWANEIRDEGGAGGVANFRKDIVIDLFDDADRKLLSYLVHRCWVSEYQALPDLDANGHAVAIEHLKLENEGWERDRTVVPPPEANLHRATERRKR